MAICAVSISGSITATSTAIGSCTDYVILTSHEYAVMYPTFTPSEVAEISFGVVSVWAAAWAIKILRRAL